MTHFTQEEIALGCRQVPSHSALDLLGGQNRCKDCAGCGSIDLFDPRHNQGWFVVFCDCEAGRKEEEDAHRRYYCSNGYETEY